MLTPDLTEATRFLDLLEPDGQFTFQVFSEAANALPAARVWHGTLADHKVDLARSNQRGAGVFVMINAGDGVVHPGRRTCRTNDNVTRIRAHVLDLSGAPLEPVLAAKASPHIVVESSPGRWHAYWRVTDCPVAEFSRGQQALAAHFGGDPKVCDLARVMRLPGFIHLKGEPFMTRLVTAASAERDTK